MSNKPFGWCFIGSGSIAHRVLADLPRSNGSYIASVYSRKLENAQKVADLCGAAAFDDLSAALAAPGVQGAYVATIHPLHKEHTLAALDAGLPVLCEKPFAVTAGEAAEMIASAREKGLYLMEGMWMRFSPGMRQALAWVAEGRIGDVRTLSATTGFRAVPPIPRLEDPAMGGGALLDVGVYTLALARLAMGRQPAKVTASAIRKPTGVDSQFIANLEYDDGATARLYGTIEVDVPLEGVICGTEGYIRLPAFWRPETVELHAPDGIEIYEANLQGEGFQFEFDAAVDDITAGRLENELVTHTYTLDVMETMDEVRRLIGYRWPGGIPG